MVGPVFILLAAWILGSVIGALGTAELIAGLAARTGSTVLLPSLVFLTGAAISFSTGTSWGTMGLLFPLAVPAAVEMGAPDDQLPIIVAAVFSGAVFGDHCSPFSDTTIVTSISCGVEPHDHVRTQIPYALITAVAAIALGFLPAGCGIPAPSAWSRGRWGCCSCCRRWLADSAGRRSGEAPAPEPRETAPNRTGHPHPLSTAPIGFRGAPLSETTPSRRESDEETAASRRQRPDHGAHSPVLIRRLAIPASVGILLQHVVQRGGYVLGGPLSTDALAALSLSFPIFFLMLAMGMGFSTGATALMGSALGAGDRREAARIASQGLILSLLVASVIMAVGYATVPALFRLLGASAEYLSICLDYMFVILAGTPIVLQVYMVNGVLNAQGDMVSFRNYLIVATVANIALDPWFMFGGFGLPAMGMKGIAAATILVQVFGLVLPAPAGPGKTGPACPPRRAPTTDA